AGPRDTPTGIDRLAGFLAAHRDLARVPGPVVDGDFSFESGVEGAREIMRRAPLLGAVFAANDLMALGALEELAHQGRRVPDDVAVMGFDDAHGLDTVDPILSTVRQDSREQGTVMGDLVLSLLAGDEPPRSTVIPTSLVLRKTA
ncbi:MAG: substrate-binding domain-containing protein, partial [Cellulomonadaceae bacterium]|nr:substrate-binding domain-containing protein [Cellulomonadaceae bacterium]